jgi:copper chaperone CopZ
MKHLIVFLFASLVLVSCADDKVETSDSNKTTPHSKTTLSKQTDIKASVISTVTIKTPTIQCKTCEKNIHKAFNRVEGITEVQVDLDKKTIKVNYDEAIINVESIRLIISKAGYDADDLKRDPSAYEKLDECCKDDTKSHS